MPRGEARISGGKVAEKRSVCRFGGQQRDDAAHVVDEAHVEHAVGLVEDEDSTLPQATALCPMRSSRRPGVATSDLDARPRARRSAG